MRSKEEDFIQRSIVDYHNMCRLEGVLFAVPNGGSRNKLEAYNLKRQGVLAGVSDLILLYGGGRSCFIEVKTPKGKQSTGQKEFQRRVDTLGHQYVVVRSLDEYVKLHSILTGRVVGI